ncbi:unnamed protein product [Linum tenue]|uniref:Uncharacterized protein n=1 Tax=Linum tenue TaxID=586396 RepID=A0AAV0JH47_9ROSI|nr:unnamed protein product [Linum tenue]
MCSISYGAGTVSYDEVKDSGANLGSKNIVRGNINFLVICVRCTDKDLKCMNGYYPYPFLGRDDFFVQRP